MSQQTLWRRLLKRPYVGINIERHARLRVTKTPGELYSKDALLVPEGGTPVPEKVRVDAGGTAHGVTKGGALNTTKGLQMGNDIGLHGYPTAATRLGHFHPHPHPQPPSIYVPVGHRYRLANPHSRVFEENASQSVARVELGKQLQEIVCVGGFWYEARRLWETDGSMAGWVLGDRVKDHPGLPDVAGDRSRPQPVADHVADPADDVGGGQ